MSRIVAAAAIRGSHVVVAEAEEKLEAAIAKHGEKQRLEFPETAFFLPMANALLGLDVSTLGEARQVLETAQSLLTDEPSEQVWLPYLSGALDAGIATLLGEELIKALATWRERSRRRAGTASSPTPSCARWASSWWTAGCPASPPSWARRPDTETAVNVDPGAAEAQHPHLPDRQSPRAAPCATS